MKECAPRALSTSHSLSPPSSCLHSPQFPSFSRRSLTSPTLSPASRDLSPPLHVLTKWIRDHWFQLIKVKSKLQINKEFRLQKAIGIQLFIVIDWPQMIRYSPQRDPFSALRP